jgi:hypothetical protein
LSFGKAVKRRRDCRQGGRYFIDLQQPGYADSGPDQLVTARKGERAMA